jgi:small-conductance mechanosensitive channel
MMRVPGSWLAVAGLLTLWLVGRPAFAAEPAAGSVAAPLSTSTGEPAELVIANRRIVALRTEIFGSSPQERVEASAERIHEIARQGGRLEVTTKALAEGTAVLVDGKIVFRVLDGDIDAETGEVQSEVAAEAVKNLQRALDEVREARDTRALLPAIGWSLLATVLLVAASWLLFMAYRWAARQAHAFVQRRFASALPQWAGHVIGEASVAGLFTLPLKLGVAAFFALLAYEWAAFVLRSFPYTRPWGEALLSNLLQALGDSGSAIAKAVPGLLVVVAIFMLTRIVVRAVRSLFESVQRGRIEVGFVDEATARPTGQLVITAIWIFAFVAAYPYIPGSQSEAFKGIGVFVGLMMSIGASGVVNQAVSGLMLMYTKALRPGEFVKIGDTEGTVRSVGFVTTRIETLRHEEVNIPNAVIASSVTRNYSRLAAQGGVWLATQVTIGYDTPWRQVHALLKLAASRTEGVAQDPEARVRQTALQDFYVEYTLLISVTDPSQRVVVLDRLHANIQDAFNEYGVQIMSPNYEDDPESPKIVPREKWYEPPAAR